VLPSLYVPPYKLFGVIPIQPFGVLVALALVVGYSLGRRRARLTGLDPQICADGQFWIVVTGFAVAHWVSLIFYFPDKVLRAPWKLLFFWEGISSFGGIIGGIIGATVFFRRRRVSIIRYVDAITFGFVPAWIIGRMGCTVVFDHPGPPTDFFLGMMHHHDRIVRHNLGMYEMLVAAALTVVLYSLKNLRPFDGFHPALMLILYSPARFLLDFLRETRGHGGDVRYFGLTPGQYFAAGLLLVGAILLARGVARGRLGRSDTSSAASGPGSIRTARGSD
jgi:phosphatidylglycerol:prolipoprotein diacylglycerol transferase